jgi:hypothetical protein
MTFLTRQPAEAPSDPDDHAELFRLLRSIDSRLALIAAPQEAELRVRLAAEVLRAGGRQALWDAIDGVRTSNDLAKAAQVSDRFAQMFVNELLALGLVRRVERASKKGTVVEKDRIGLVQWYLSSVSGETAGEVPPGRVGC